jgi:hypothetical protein
MAKQSNGKKKARIYYERLDSNPPPVFVKVGRPLNKTKQLAK